MRAAAVILRCLIAANWIGFAISCNGCVAQPRVMSNAGWDLARNELFPDGNGPNSINDPAFDRYELRAEYYRGRLAGVNTMGRFGWQAFMLTTLFNALVLMAVFGPLTRRKPM
jgi:hypothetical protein